MYSRCFPILKVQYWSHGVLTGMVVGRCGAVSSVRSFSTLGGNPSRSPSSCLLISAIRSFPGYSASSHLIGTLLIFQQLFSPAGLSEFYPRRVMMRPCIQWVQFFCRRRDVNALYAFQGELWRCVGLIATFCFCAFDLIPNYWIGENSSCRRFLAVDSSWFGCPPYP